MTAKTNLWWAPVVAVALLATCGCGVKDAKAVPQASAPAPAQAGAMAAEPSSPIKVIMKKAHGKNNLAKKLLQGTASEQEKTDLVQLYESLTNAEPPKGDLENWKDRTGNLLAAAQAAVTGGQEELANFRQAVDCKTCHDAHKPSAD